MNVNADFSTKKSPRERGPKKGESEKTRFGQTKSRIGDDRGFPAPGHRRERDKNQANRHRSQFISGLCATGRLGQPKAAHCATSALPFGDDAASEDRLSI
jgi:hypothetical protein